MGFLHKMLKFNQKIISKNSLLYFFMTCLSVENTQIDTKTIKRQ